LDAGGTYTGLAGCGVLDEFLVDFCGDPSWSGMYNGPLRPQPASRLAQTKLPISMKKCGVRGKPKRNFTIKITV